MKLYKCTAAIWYAPINNQCCNIVYLGMYIYCKMIHGPSNVKFSVNIFKCYLYHTLHRTKGLEKELCAGRVSVVHVILM